MTSQGGVYVEDFAIQVFPVWLAVVIVIAGAFGLWKLAKIVWAVVSNRPN